MGLEPILYGLKVRCLSPVWPRSHWWKRQDLNLQPRRCQRLALPIVLHPHWLRNKGSNLDSDGSEPPALPIWPLRNVSGSTKCTLSVTVSTDQFALFDFSEDAFLAHRPTNQPRHIDVRLSSDVVELHYIRRIPDPAVGARIILDPVYEIPPRVVPSLLQGCCVSHRGYLSEWCL